MTAISTAKPVHQDRSRATLERLLAAAEDLLRREGLEGATVEAIARKAGVSPAVLYRRFPDKDALLRSVYDAYFARRSDSNAQALDPARWKGKSAAEIVTAFIAGAIAGARLEGKLISSLTQFAASHTDPRFRQKAARINAGTHARLIDVIVAAVPARQRRTVARNAEFAIDVLMLVLRGFLVERAPASGLPPADDVLIRDLSRMICLHLGVTARERRAAS